MVHRGKLLPAVGAVLDDRVGRREVAFLGGRCSPSDMLNNVFVVKHVPYGTVLYCTVPGLRMISTEVLL